jgi:mRNA-degrading endonuclease toxin of MazEF toxin-antitoxin module
MAAVKNPPGRGQIWFVQLPVDPPDKGKRPVVIVSLDARNRHERADTVLVIPLSTSIHKANHPTHLFLAAGESGLSEDSIARAEDITVIRKVHLIEPRSALRTLSHRRVCELAEMVKVAMGCL